eukprot:TRINITY_DN53231_c0_g1_i1.p1 TRINITY_DN53231_c0_g1~~TRINITY_DN53231_c0_g1_i1.p1  ORF type:complete len:141 (+),score=21.73 TRINITY_DN53231_c0_g1_i1:47-424(+)
MLRSLVGSEMCIRDSKCKISVSGKLLQPLLDALRVASSATPVVKKPRAPSTSAAPAPVEVKQPQKLTRTPSNIPKPQPPNTVTTPSLPPLVRKTSSRLKVESRRPSQTEQVPITTFNFTDGAQKK